MIEDVARDPRFAKDVAEGTGYVPQGLMAVPLLHDERALGVLEVLDRQSRFTLEEMELLGLFASQAAIALDLLQRAARGGGGARGRRRRSRAVARVAAALGELPTKSDGRTPTGCSRRSRTSSDANEPGRRRAHSISIESAGASSIEVFSSPVAWIARLLQRVLVRLDVVVVARLGLAPLV